MTKKQLAAMKRIIRRGKKNPAAPDGEIHSGDFYGVTDTFMVISYKTAVPELPKDEKYGQSDLFIQHVRENIENGCFNLIEPNVTEEELRDVLRNHKAKDGRAYVMLQATDENGTKMLSPFNVCYVLDAIESVGRKYKLYLGKLNASQTYTALLVTGDSVQGCVLPINVRPEVYKNLVYLPKEDSKECN